MNVNVSVFMCERGLCECESTGAHYMNVSMSVCICYMSVNMSVSWMCECLLFECACNCMIISSVCGKGCECKLYEHVRKSV